MAPDCAKADNAERRARKLTPFERLTSRAVGPCACPLEVYHLWPVARPHEHERDCEFADGHGMDAARCRHDWPIRAHQPVAYHPVSPRARQRQPAQVWRKRQQIGGREEAAYHVAIRMGAERVTQRVASLNQHESPRAERIFDARPVARRKLEIADDESRQGSLLHRALHSHELVIVNPCE